MNQLLKSVVRKNRTLRSVGAGTGDRPGHPVEISGELWSTYPGTKLETADTAKENLKLTGPPLLGVSARAPCAAEGGSMSPKLRNLL